VGFGPPTNVNRVEPSGSAPHRMPCNISIEAGREILNPGRSRVVSSGRLAFAVCNAVQTTLM
jgi:hypothetical protein